MNINKKIEEIRQKPERERIRYVWGMVIVSMFFIIVLWIISLKDNLKGSYSTASDSISSEQINLENEIDLEK